jgi:hypothetical protein
MPGAPGPPGGRGDTTSAVKVRPFAVMVCASTINRLNAPGLLTPVKVTREPSLIFARNGSPVSEGKKTTVPSLRIRPSVSPFGPKLKALIVPLPEYAGWGANPGPEALAAGGGTGAPMVGGGGAPCGGDGGGCCALPMPTQRVAASSAVRGTDVRFMIQTSDNEIAGLCPTGSARGAMKRGNGSVRKANGR